MIGESVSSGNLSSEARQAMLFLTRIAAIIGAVVFASNMALAQFTTILNLPSDVLPFPIGSNTQVNLYDGGLIPLSSQSGASNGTSSNIEINVFGGTVENQMRLFSGTTFNVSGGIVGSELQAFSGSIVNISGGRILQTLTANSGSTINVSGGIVDPRFKAGNGSSVFVTGGSIGSEFRIENGSQVSQSNGEIASASIQPGGTMSMTGGSARLVVQGNLTLSGGAVRRNFETYAGGQARILGGEYRLNGVPIAELQNIGDTFGPDVPDGAVLSGTLADGTPFAFSSWNDDEIADGTLILENVALPAIGPAIILASTDPVPRGIRQGQQLVIDTGSTSPALFNAGWGSSVVVQAGGVLAGGFEGVHANLDIEGGTAGSVIVYSQSTITIADGSNVSTILADGGSTIEIDGGATDFVDVVGGSVMNMHAGAITSGFNVHNNATTNIYGGTVGPILRPLSGSTLNVHGGKLGSGIRPAGQVTITGGTIGDLFEPLAGSTVHISGGSLGDAFRAQAGSAITLSGGDFRINDTPIPGLGSVGVSLPINVPLGAVLSGILSDGTPFAFASTDDDVLTNGTITLETTLLPVVTDTDLIVPGNVVGQGIRGQTLTVLGGGAIGDNFNVGPDSVITLLSGGTIGANLEVLGAELNILGGSVGASLDAFAGTVANIYGGTIGGSLGAHPGSVVNVLGGSIGSGVRAFDDSVINFRGTEFFLNGAPIAGIIPGIPFELATRTGVLSGLLKDGSSISLTLHGTDRQGARLISPNAMLNLMVVPEPGSAVLLVVVFISTFTRRPTKC
jgi:hypothetical protein